ncbi:unnamed protein product, partial [Rotaria magnacalcarata]
TGKGASVQPTTAGLPITGTRQQTTAMASKLTSVVGVSGDPVIHSKSYGRRRRREFV